MARLNDQHIADIWAYGPRRWPDSRPVKGEPVVTAIRYEEPEGQGARANPPPRLPLVIPVPQEGPDGAGNHRSGKTAGDAEMRCYTREKRDSVRASKQ